MRTSNWLKGDAGREQQMPRVERHFFTGIQKGDFFAVM